MKRMLLSIWLCPLLVSFSVHGDETGETIRRSLALHEPSIVRVHYTFETAKSNLSFMIEDASGGTREKEGEGVCLGLVLENNLILVGGHIFPDPHAKTMSFGAQIMGEATSPPKDFEVVGFDGEKSPAELLARDEDLNLAFLEVSSSSPDWKPIDFDDQAALQIGEPFLILTFLEKKYDYQRSFTMGRVTGIAEGDIRRYLQSSIISGGLGGGSRAIGGPVISLDSGQIVGVLARPRQTSQNEVSTSGLSSGGARKVFSVALSPSVPQILPASALLPVLRDPMGTLGEKGWIGIESLQPLTRALSLYFGREDGAGAVVNLVGEGSPAASAGILAEDILIALGGEEVRAKDQNGINDILRRIRRSKVGTELELVVLRNGEEKTFTVAVAAAPKSAFDAEIVVDEVFGVTVAEVTYDLIQRKNLDPEDLGRVIVRKVPLAGFFSMAGLTSDDIILGVDSYTIEDISSFRDVMKKIKDSRKKEVLVKIKRGADTRYQKVEPDW